MQTKVIPNNENPVWNEEFDFVIDSPVSPRHQRAQTWQGGGPAVAGRRARRGMLGV